MIKATVPYFACLAMLAATSTGYAQDVAPGSAGDVTKQIQERPAAPMNPPSDSGIPAPVPGNTLPDPAENPAIRQDPNPGATQGPVQVPPAGTADPRALPGAGNVPKGG